LLGGVRVRFVQCDKLVIGEAIANIARDSAEQVTRAILPDPAVMLLRCLTLKCAVRLRWEYWRRRVLDFIQAGA
jgi:hypothetical protein